MRAMRFSMVKVMGFVAFAAMGVVALKFANDAWSSVCFTLMLIALVLAILHAVQARGKDRAYWTGFAVAGWAYAGVLFGPLGMEDQSITTAPTLAIGFFVDLLETVIHPEVANAGNSFTFTATTTSPATFTSVNFNLASAVAPTPGTPPLAPAPAPVLAPLPAAVVNVAAPVSIAATAPTATPPVIPATMTMPTFAMSAGDMTRIAYFQVAHSIATLLAGMFGGLYSAWLVGRRQRREAAGAPPAGRLTDRTDITRPGGQRCGKSDFRSAG